MSWNTYLPYLVVMAAVTYLIRMLPLTVFRKPIHSVFIRSFLKYVPYAVLSAMTIPEVLYSTGYTGGAETGPLFAALAGLIVAVVFAWRNRSMVTVAIAACLAVAAVQGVQLLL